MEKKSPKININFAKKEILILRDISKKEFDELMSTYNIQGSADWTIKSHKLIERKEIEFIKCEHHNSNVPYLQ